MIHGRGAQAGRYLIAKRPPGGAYGGCWEFPGGKVELGETPQAALVRELQEELGIDVAVGEVFTASFDADERRELILLIFECTHLRGEPAALEVAAFEWVTPQALVETHMPPPDRPAQLRVSRMLS